MAFGCDTCVGDEPPFPQGDSNRGSQMKIKIASLLGSDTTIPQQYFETLRRSEHLEPEKTLLLTMLEDAIHDYRKYSFARDPVGKERFQEAEGLDHASRNRLDLLVRKRLRALGLGSGIFAAWAAAGAASDYAGWQEAEARRFAPKNIRR